MDLLLTPSQQSTLWHMCQQLKTEDGNTYFHFPIFLKDCGGGFFEKLTFDALPDNAKDQLLKLKGIK